MPTLVEKVDALRRFFGTLSALELPPAIVAMNGMMGIVAEGALPEQVDKQAHRRDGRVCRGCDVTGVTDVS